MDPAVPRPEKPFFLPRREEKQKGPFWGLRCLCKRLSNCQCSRCARRVVTCPVLDNDCPPYIKFLVVTFGGHDPIIQLCTPRTCPPIAHWPTHHSDVLRRTASWNVSVACPFTESGSARGPRPVDLREERLKHRRTEDGSATCLQIKRLPNAPSTEHVEEARQVEQRAFGHTRRDLVDGSTIKIEVHRAIRDAR